MSTIVTMTVKFVHPFTCMVAGPTGSGKTVFVRKLLKYNQDLIEKPPQKIIWCYGVYQKAYTEMMAEVPTIEFIEGFPSSFDGVIDPNLRNLIIVDDLMAECTKDANMTSLFTRGSHHRNLSVIFIVQNLFHAGKETRTISLNAQYLVIYKNPRDKSQITHLGRQLYPGQTKYVQEAYNDATKNPYGYLLIDLKANTLESHRLRTHIFPNEFTTVYVPKK